MLNMLLAPMSPWVVVAIVVAAVILILIISFIRIIPQSTAVVVERLGRFSRVLNTGLHLVFPFIDRIVDPPVEKCPTNKHRLMNDNHGIPVVSPARVISLREKLLDFEANDVITKDNVTMKIDTIVYCQVTDPKLYTYGAENPICAIQNLTITTIRNIVGELELDETLTSRDLINSRMRKVLDDATGSWGVKINRVEIQKIEPPESIRRAMEKQATAEREKRAEIIAAEGSAQAAIITAEGGKKAAILREEGISQARILEADSSKQAEVLRAEGQSKAIELINYSFPETQYMTLQAYEALKALADGQATKIIVPSEIQNIAGLLAGLKGVVEDVPTPGINADLKKSDVTVVAQDSIVNTDVVVK